MSDKQEEKLRLLCEHVESESFSTLSAFRDIIEMAVEKGDISSPEEKELFLALGSYFLIKSEINSYEDEYLFNLEQNLKDEFLSCGEVPGSDKCHECSITCPFKEPEKEQSEITK